MFTVSVAGFGLSAYRRTADPPIGADPSGARSAAGLGLAKPHVTVTKKEQVADSPLTSLACQITDEVPTGNIEPLAKPIERNIALTPQLSVAVGVGYTTGVLQALAGLFCTIFCGQTMLGGKLSVTVTTKAQVLERPAPSMARHVTVVLPVGKVDPLAGPPMRVTVTVPQLSVAVGVG